MKIDHIPFSIKAILGRADIPMQSYLDLQVGDIIVLEQNTDKPLTVQVGSKECYRATVGLFETHKAVVIDGPLYP